MSAARLVLVLAGSCARPSSPPAMASTTSEQAFLAENDRGPPISSALLF